MIAVCLNHVIWGLGCPSTLQTNSTCAPSGALCDLTFSVILGAKACSFPFGSKNKLIMICQQ